MPQFRWWHFNQNTVMQFLPSTTRSIGQGNEFREGE